MADIKNISVDGTVYDIKDETARSQIGDLSGLSTTDQSSLVAAINELASQIGSGSGGESLTAAEEVAF